MGIFKKLKDVLFEIEEDELPIITKEDVKKESSKKVPKYQEENTIQEIKIPKEELEHNEELEKTFNFPLDLEENKILRRNNIDYKEKEDYLDIFSEENFNKRVETRSRDLIRDSYDKESRPSRVFKSSPIISPVYGILDQNYCKDDVIVKTDIGVKGPNLDEVRKKAYGIENKKNKIEDKKVTHDEFDDSLKTLDEILMEEDKPTKEIKLPKKKDNIEEKEGKLSDTKIVQNIDDNNIETDLFNLIDSMYEDKEGEEE
ncbi:MAG: hypothetical protein PHD03_03275 [Bacilli bacterium]|nr:hypothetical protein [Bacilli bacterium]MDD4406457.1 hypothetical protein [Bacilli bacterium]